MNRLGPSPLTKCLWAGTTLLALLVAACSRHVSDDGESKGGKTEDPLNGAVEFSVSSRTFIDSISVGMSGASDIRYTTDGSAPTALSTLWDGNELTLTETTQLRAGVFEEGAQVGQSSAAIFIRRTFEFSSDLPIVIMEGYGGGKPQNKIDWLDLGLMIFEPRSGRTISLGELPTMVSRAGYRRRGQSSQNFAKTPYRVELWDQADLDADQTMLGMPADSDWAVIGPCSDRTLIRNAFVYSLASELSLVTMELRFAEVFINQDNSPLEESDYEGVYTISETVKNQKSRVNLKQLRETDTSEALISGGYIFKFDQAAVDPGEAEIPCTSGGQGCFDDLELVDPDPANQQQLSWISNHLSQFNSLLHAQPIGDYQSMIDVPSFVDHYIINEITMDVDAYIRSHYMHKDRDGLIKAGPIWDYNFTMGNVAEATDGWQYLEGRNGSNDWHRIMGPEPDFHEKLVTRYRSLRSGLLSDAQLHARVDKVAAPLINASSRDFARWPVGGECAVGGAFGMSYDPGPPSWPEQIQSLKNWLSARLAWLDAAMVAP